MPEYIQTFFKSKHDYRNYALLRILADSPVPLGSWVLREKMAQFDIDISTASIGRLLKEFDHKGYTELIKNQGRKLSHIGMKQLGYIEDELNRYQIEKEFINASKPKSYQDLLDLLHARKVIEMETARLAALHVHEEDIKKMELTIEKHSCDASHQLDLTEVSCHFHELVADASGNRFLCSTLKLLILEEIELEKTFPYLAAHTQGGHFAPDHSKVLEAIKAGDADTASAEMEKHMEKLILAIKTSIKGGER
ncbi:FCD domain-containing protein [Bacillus infantis]|uniref:FCD domain-containing protein n=1 Tax=Bacillus infantis TaxID=324767 RepID=A0A5D4RG36_9BACI|nr:FCD domain-containing protein [Bacillus infantis]TYS50385.1 FCD domain-containing protein [Bacillus infantis]